MTGAPDVAELVCGLRSGNRRALARAITLVESSHDRDMPRKAALLDSLIEFSGSGVRIGVSGTPGVGKSTLIERIGAELIDRGLRVAVLAVDPSSARTGGSILGDKTRMPRLAVDPNAYVRPSPAGFGLGGITTATSSAVRVCEAAGYDLVLVETVGVGQSETAVAGVTDLFLLLHSPGGGDELQGIKRGVMELADRVTVTKADGDLLPAAQRAQAELRSALHLMRPKPGRGMTPVGMCSAVTGEGIAELIDGLLDQHRELASSGELERLRAEQAEEQFRSALDAGLLLRAESAVATSTGEAQHSVRSRERSPIGAAWSVLSRLPGKSVEVNAITLLVSDMARSIEFYRTCEMTLHFGGDAEPFSTMAHGSNFVNLELADTAKSIEPWGRAVLLVADPDALHKRLQDAGYQATTAPADAPWGERYFHISDPDGHEISFARKL